MHQLLYFFALTEEFSGVIQLKLYDKSERQSQTPGKTTQVFSESMNAVSSYKCPLCSI